MKPTRDMALPDTVAAVRRFNRFYTRAIGVLAKGHLGGPYTLAESRVLYEIASADGVTPKDIIAATGLDAGYLSRIVARLERDGLAAREQSSGDRRSITLRITPNGQDVYAGLHQRTVAQVEGLIGNLSDAQQGRLTGALEDVERLLEMPASTAGYALRPLRVGDVGWVVQRHGLVYAREYGWDERFEAMCAQIAGAFVTGFDPARERGWIAEREGENVGCVFLARSDEPSTAKLRLLLVEPSARGLGLGRRLVDECIGFARAAGYTRITLWTQSVLVAARRIYAAAGFELVDTWPNRDFGGWDLTSERWDLDL